MNGVDPDIIKRLADLADGDNWAMGDLLAEVFPPGEYGDADHGANSGLIRQLAAYHSALLVDHGIDLAVNTMRLYRATAIKWPDDTRVSSASFSAHRLLKGDDRFGRMARYIDLARRENRALSASMVKRYRDDEKPRHVRTMQELLRRRIETAVKGVLAAGLVKSSLPERWWEASRITPPQRAIAVAELRALADRIEST